MLDKNHAQWGRVHYWISSDAIRQFVLYPSLYNVGTFHRQHAANVKGEKKEKKNYKARLNTIANSGQKAMHSQGQ